MLSPLTRPDRLSSGSRLATEVRPDRWLAALLLAALVVGGVLWLDDHGAADSIDEVALAGPRGSACLRLVVGNDVSGSMSDFADARESALRDFLSWAPRNLRDDDELGVVDFAGAAAWTRQPTPVAEPAVRGAAADVYQGDQTLLAPVLALAQALPPSHCRTALLLFSDAQLADLPQAEQEGRAAVQAAGVHDVVLLVPGEDIDVPEAWGTSFPAAEPRYFDGLDADETGLTVASVVAELTGQELQRR
ncbi:VWA domain-containing protein [Blastococcus sp. CT_GayMR20]|uniref:VWA domain-containing protein n=1 Tax=Blastococcus sp. CT_GayMR20 TaxID=2559609 RepID=UPI001073C8FD|nr:VWA domain-containing protein [Blastococcus sp. CT_GayMR20]TFV66835.1 VWA domain-containing protein [Blastococcus sp. CT_GayMR20]